MCFIALSGFTTGRSFTPAAGDSRLAVDTRTVRTRAVALLAAVLIVSAIWAVFCTTAAEAQNTVPVAVRVTRVLSPVAGGYETGARGPHDTGQPDFYARVTIDGVARPLRVDDHPHDKNPVDNWPETIVAVPAGAATVPVKIEVWDHDLCSPAGMFSTSCDDLVRLDGGPTGNGVLDLTYDLAADTWSGETSKRCSLSGSFPPGFICFEIGDDSDLDGLFDSWERDGLDADGDTIVDLDLPALGARPDHKDIFVENDWLAGALPTTEGIRLAKRAFELAPPGAGGAPNPDGKPGIALHIDTGSLSETANAEDGAAANTCGDGVDNGSDGATDAADLDCRVGDDLGGGNEVTGTQPICTVADENSSGQPSEFKKARDANFNAARKLVFHYAISGPGCDENADGKKDNGGQGEQGGNDFAWFNHGSPESEAAIFVHELGHNLALDHGGSGPDNCKPNYISVMNYDHSGGIRRLAGKKLVDLSPARTLVGSRAIAPLSDLVENDLSEEALDPTDDTNMYVFVNANGDKVARIANQAPDWNGDGDDTDVRTPTSPPLAVNVDTAGKDGTQPTCSNSDIRDSTKPLKGHDDWSNIVLPFRQYGAGADGPRNPPNPDPDPTTQQILALDRQLDTTDAAVSLTDAPDPAIAGSQLAYTATATNKGPNPAVDTKLLITLPAHVAYVSDDSGCVPAGGTISCSLGPLLAGESRQVTVTVRIARGAPKMLAATAAVAHRGPDPEATNDTATADTTVIRRVAFASTRTGNGDIYAIDPTGGTPTQLTNGRAIDAEPEWSPDGGKIAFTRVHHGNVDIYVMDADGSHVTRLTTHSRRDRSPSWSPNGTRIAFASDRTNGNWDVYAMNADDGGSVTRLTTHVAADLQPTWSPDGGKIAFSSTRTGNGDIYAMSADGSAQTRLTTAFGVDSEPAWSGSTIAFSSSRHGWVNFEIYRMNEDGSGQTRLTNNARRDIAPAWSRDGAKLAVATDRHGNHNFEIYTMNPDGTGETRLTVDPAIDTQPAW